MNHSMRMSLSFFLSLVGFFCRAQDCESVQKIEAKDGIAYMGIVTIPSNNNPDANALLSFFLGKSVTPTDTSFLVNFGGNVTVLSAKFNPEEITFQFDDDSVITRSNQQIEAFRMGDTKAMVTAQLALRLEELLRIKNKRLTHIIVGDSKTIVPEQLARSINEVATCLLTKW